MPGMTAAMRRACDARAGASGTTVIVMRSPRNAGCDSQLDEQDEERGGDHGEPVARQRHSWGPEKKKARKALSLPGLGAVDDRSNLLMRSRSVCRQRRLRRLEPRGDNNMRRSAPRTLR